MKKFVASAVVILFFGALFGAGIYGWKNPDTRAKLKDFFASLYDRVLDVGRADHISTPPVSNVGAVPFRTSMNIESIKAIRALLMDRNFEKLNALLENYEKTYGVKDDLIDVYDSFSVYEPGLEDMFSEWVAKFPDNYQPYLARGVYYVYMGYASRGTAWAKDTTNAQFAKMEHYFSLAEQDIDKAMAMDRNIVAPYFFALRVFGASSNMSKDRAIEILKQGLAINPASFRLRSIYLLRITPRWGGSYEEMDAFAADAQKYAADNPRIAALRGYAYYDAGDMKLISGDYTASLALLDKALTYGELPLFLTDRATAYMNLQMPAEALKDIIRALELAQNDGEAYLIRSELLAEQGRLKEASADIEMANAIDPNSPDDKDKRRSLSDKQVYVAYQLQKKDLSGSIGRYDLAVRYDPGNASAYYWRARAYVSENNLEAAYSDLQKAIELKPDYFEAYFILDNAVLSRRQDWADIISYWDRYIALHPEDGRAYLERGGAHFHNGNLVEAVKDAKRAADRGDAEGRKIYERFKNKVRLD